MALSFLDALLGGLKSVAVAGVAVSVPVNVVPPSVLNFASGATAAYNATTGQIDVTVTAGGASVTGTGLVHVTSGTIDSSAYLGTAGQLPFTNAAASATIWANLSQDVTLSAASPGVATVVGLQTRAVASTAPSNGQVLGWSSGSSNWQPISAASISGSLSGDVTGTLGATTVIQATAATGNWNWASTVSAPSITQTSESTAIKGADLLIQPQQSTHATDQGGGNLIVNLQAPTGAGAECQFIVERGGVNQFAAGALIGAPSQGAFWMHVASPTGSNYTFHGDGSTFAGFNGPGLLQMEVSGVIELSMHAAGVTLFQQTSIDAGGTGILGIANASGAPSGSPSGGIVAWASSANTLNLLGSTGPALVILTTTAMAIAPASTTGATGATMSLNGGNTVTSGQNGGGVALNGGAGVGTGIAGGAFINGGTPGASVTTSIVALQTNGVATLEVTDQGLAEGHGTQALTSGSNVNIAQSVYKFPSLVITGTVTTGTSLTFPQLASFDLFWDIDTTGVTFTSGSLAIKNASGTATTTISSQAMWRIKSPASAAPVVK